MSVTLVKIAIIYCLHISLQSVLIIQYFSMRRWPSCCFRLSKGHLDVHSELFLIQWYFTQNIFTNFLLLTLTYLLSVRRADLDPVELWLVNCCFFPLGLHIQNLIYDIYHQWSRSDLFVYLASLVCSSIIE